MGELMKTRSPITTHVLDTSAGKPAAGVVVLLEKKDAKGNWTELSKSTTNQDGRVEDLLSVDAKIESGIYRLQFEVGAYYKGNTFYPSAMIIFEIKNPSEHYHVPLLLSPYGLSTYRGS